MGGVLDTDLDENYSELIRDFSQGRTISNLRWMMRRTNFVTTNCYAQFKLNNSDDTIPIEEIFIPINGRSRPRRILIESHHRYDNRIFANKFLYDWAHRELYMNQFKFVFLISLKNLGKYSVEGFVEHIAIELGLRKSKIKTMHRLIEKFGDYTLLILDGLDEANSGARRSVDRMIYQERYRNVTIIITNQRELYRRRVNTREIYFVENVQSEVYYDRKLTIQSLDHEHRDLFIDTMVSGVSKEQFRTRVQSIVESMDDIFVEHPLYFVLLNYIVLENMSITVDTITTLFKEMMNQIVKLSLKNSVHDNFDFFREDKLNESYRNTFYRFGKISMKKILENDLEFELSDLTDEMYKMGFLILRERSEDFYGARFYYDGFYPTVYEFSVAFFIWEEWKKNKKRFPQKTIVEINDIFLRFGDKTYVVMFICGLMDKNCGEFFKQFKNYSALYSTNSRGIGTVFEECQFNRNFHESISMFIPPEFYLSGPVVIKEREIIKMGLTKNRIFKLNISVEQLWHLPRDIKNALLRISVKQHFPMGLSENAADKMKCRKLAYVFNLKPVLSVDSMRKYLLFYNRITAPVKSLYFYGDLLNQSILDCIYNGDFKNSKIDELTFTLTGDPSGRKIVEFLISNNKVRQLTLILELNCQMVDIRKILNTVIMSPYLESLKLYNFTNLELFIELKELTLHGSKHWQKLWLHNVIIECKSSFSKPQCIASYAVNHCRFSGNFINILTAITPNILYCNFNTMHMMIKSLKSPAWCGWGSISELTLVFSDSDSAVFLEYVPLLSPITYIDMLKIEIRKELSKKELAYLISSMKMFKIFHFGVEWDRNYFDNVFTIVNGIIDAVNEGEQGKLASIDVYVNDTEQDVANVSILLPLLLRCLQVDYPKRINLFASLANTLHLLLKQNVIDQNIFVTEHFIASSGVKLAYYEYKYDINHMLSVRLR